MHLPERRADSFSEDRPLGWDPVAEGNRAGDGMACNSNDRRQWRKQGGAVGAAASKTQAKRGGCWEPQPVFVSEEKAPSILPSKKTKEPSQFGKALRLLTSADCRCQSSRCAWTCGPRPGWRRRSFQHRHCPASGSPPLPADAAPTPCGGCGWVPAQPA